MLMDIATKEFNSLEIVGAETSAKMVYENLMKYTDDPLVKESLPYLMTIEVAHFQMFQAALDSITPNFPPVILQSDPRYSNKYFNMSKGEKGKGPWNQGKSPELGEEWQVIDKPEEHIQQTNGLLDAEAKGTKRTEKSVQKDNKSLRAKREKEIDEATLPKNGVMSWSVYQDDFANKSKKDSVLNGLNEK